MVDDDLITQCRAGSEAAFRALYYRTMPRVRTWVARFLGPGAPLHDVVQDVFVQVHRSIGSFRGEAAFATWLYRIALNVATSHLRRSWREEQRRGTPYNQEEPSYQDEGRLRAREELRRLYGALDSLSLEKRIAFVLFEIEGMTLREIADLTGAGVPTVAARLRRARLAVIKSLADAAEGLLAREMKE